MIDRDGESPTYGNQSILVNGKRPDIVGSAIMLTAHHPANQTFTGNTHSIRRTAERIS